MGSSESKKPSPQPPPNPAQQVADYRKKAADYELLATVALEEKTTHYAQAKASLQNGDESSAEHYLT
jgi:hypothetical protein